MKKQLRILSLTAGLVALATLTACVAPQPVYETSRYPYQPHVQPAYVAPQPYGEYGRIVNIEVVRSESAGAAPSGGGAVAGGLIGGVVGNQFGHGGGRAAATALGIVGGALLGNTVEANANAPRAYQSYRISVQVERGGYRAFDVPTPGELRVGDRVVINNGQLSRY